MGVQSSSSHSKTRLLERGCKTIKTKILIVEDEIIEAMVLRRLLERWGYDVCEIASSGEDALKEAEVERPDLVVIDIHIHGKMSGIEAAGMMRRRFRMPVIFMTGYSDEETRQKAGALNPAGYFIKPINYEKLRETLTSIRH